MIRFSLTARDLALFETLLSFRYLRREHIQQLFFPQVSTSTTNRRLKLLENAGYLRSERPVQPMGEGTSQKYYYLTKVSAKALVEFGKVDELTIKQHLRRDHRAKYDFRAHNLAVNDFHVLVCLAVRQHNWKIERWMTEFELRQQRIQVTIPQNVRRQSDQKKLPLRPDAFFSLARTEPSTQTVGRSHYFVEVDRSTESHATKIEPKIVAYLAHYVGGQYFEIFGNKSLRVLFVTKTHYRLKNLIQTTRQAQGGSLFWFAVQSELNPDNLFDEPVWYPAHLDQPQGLFDFR